MSKSIKIYCEGKRGSHDYDVLDKVIEDINVSISIQPIGSKKGAGSAIQVYEKLADKSDVYYFFRDRDFDIKVPDNPSLTIDRYILYSYRTTIENYLFDSNNFYEFISEKKFQQKYNINSLSDAQKIFILAAKKIAYYQALRHTMGKMRIPTDFGTTWVEQGSGTLPDNLDKTYCRSKALEKVEAAKLQTDSWTDSDFDLLLDSFCQIFDSPDFYTNSLFLVWFQGKDFAKSLSLLLPQFPMADYYRYAKKHFDYKQFEDLKELKTLIENAG
jgi:hypothetical protein